MARIPGSGGGAVNGDRAEADLATSGEVDTYHFEVASVATHIMTTEGPSDTVLTSHWPADPGAVLAWDDNRGRRCQRPASRESCSRASTGCPCAIRTATPLVSTQWAPPPGLMIFSNPALDGLVRTLS